MKPLHGVRNWIALTPESAGPVRVFFALQLADVVTTLLFLSMGIAETNPLASHLMERLGPVPGLLLLKMAAISIAVLCRVTAHPTFLRRINWVYVVMVMLNVLTIIHARW